MQRNAKQSNRSGEDKGNAGQLNALLYNAMGDSMELEMACPSFMN